MRISDLVTRFKFYAENHVNIRHDDSIKSKHAFFHLEGEEFQSALLIGMSLPCLLLQTPEVEKGGEYDNKHEITEFTYVLLEKLGSKTKATVLDSCKDISDDIYNLVCLDLVNEVLPGVVSGSTEGIVGPLSDKMYGWGKSISLTDAYNAQVNPLKWLHMTPDLEEQP